MSENVFNLVSDSMFSSKMTSLTTALNTLATSLPATSYKAVTYSNNTLRFYTTTAMTDSPSVINLPEEMYLDQNRTTIVNPFTWSSTLYPGSTDPDLDGQAVFVLAVKGDGTHVEYSFVAIPSLVTVDTEMSDSSTNPVQNKVIKGYVDTGVATGFKGAVYTNNTLSLYKTAAMSDTPITVSLPEERYLDLPNTVIVDNFVWSNETYPGSTDPQLDGNTVLVLALKGDAGDTYKFLQMATDVPIASASTAGKVKVGGGFRLAPDGTISVTTGVYSITYDLDGGTNNPDNPAMYSYNTEPFTLGDPTKTGHVFLGWTGSNGNIPQKNVQITPSASSTNLSYTANWQAETYTITYDVDGTTTTTSAAYGTKLTKPSDPTKNGYTFRAWQKNGVDYDFDTLVTGPFTLVATWTLNTYSITYTLNGGTNAVGNPSSYNITSSTITLGDATKTGYTFNGWTGSNGNTPQKNVTIPNGSYGNKSYTANFTINSYTVAWKQVFKSKNGDVIDQVTQYTQQVNYGNTPVAGYPTSITPVDKYTSPDNWVYEGTSTVFNPSATITSDTVVCAYYVRQSTTYGYKCETSNSSPSGRITYVSGTDNENFNTPASMGSSTFNYGDWSGAFIFDYFKPCALKYDGTVDYYLNPNDYSKKLDGTSSDYNNSSYAGNMMVQVKKMYTKRTSSGGYNYFYVSDTKLDSSYECDAFIDASGNEKEYIYLPLFKGSYISSKLRSISGQTPGGSQTTATEVSYANALGTGWQIWDHSCHELIRDLCTLISKTTDSQTAFGYGYANGNSSVHTTGTLYNKGAFWGEAGGKQQVKVFHIEDFWGNRWERELGLILSSNGSRGTIYTKGTPPYSYDSISTYTNQGDCGATSSTGRYFKDVLWYKNGQVPKYSSTNGSASTYDCDYGYWNVSSGLKIAIFGGFYRNGTSAGSSYVGLYDAADASSSYYGASPVYK